MWDPSEAKPYDVSQFRVGVGKEKLSYDAIENQKEQKFEVERIFYDPGYNHATGNYASDIVLIVLKTTIEFKSYITPICIPYGLTYDDRVVPAGWKGRVAGWGKTSSGVSCEKCLFSLKVVSIGSFFIRRAHPVNT